MDDADSSADGIFFSARDADYSACEFPEAPEVHGTCVLFTAHWASLQDERILGRTGPGSSQKTWTRAQPKSDSRRAVFSSWSSRDVPRSVRPKTAGLAGTYHPLRFSISGRRLCRFTHGWRTCRVSCERRSPGRVHVGVGRSPSGSVADRSGRRRIKRRKVSSRNPCGTSRRRSREAPRFGQHDSSWHRRPITNSSPEAA